MIYISHVTYILYLWRRDSCVWSCCLSVCLFNWWLDCFKSGPLNNSCFWIRAKSLASYNFLFRLALLTCDFWRCDACQELLSWRSVCVRVFQQDSIQCNKQGEPDSWWQLHMNQSSLRNNCFKTPTFQDITDWFWGLYREYIYPSSVKKTQKTTTWTNWLD